MAAFRAKQAKIKLLCERAEQDEVQREELESRGLSRHEIDRAIQESRLEKFRPRKETNPWDEMTKVAPTLTATNIGLVNTHLVKTTTQDLYAPVQKKVEKYKAQKQTAIRDKGLDGEDDQKNQTSEFDQARKTRNNIN